MKNKNHTGAAFGIKPEQEGNNNPVNRHNGPLPKLNAVTAARPSINTQQTPHVHIDHGHQHHGHILPAGHAPITDAFMGTNRYVGGKSIRINEFGGVDIGVGQGPDGVPVGGNQIVHIHTAKVIHF